MYVSRFMAIRLNIQVRNSFFKTFFIVCQYAIYELLTACEQEF